MITGGCLCRSVRYRAESLPITTRLCWCRFCQYIAAGNSAVSVCFATDGFSIEGELADYASVADSGNDNSVNTDNSDSSINVADSGNDNSVDNSDSSVNLSFADNSVANSNNTDSSVSTMVLTSMELEAAVSNVSVNGGGWKDGEVETGAIDIDDGAFANFGGINTSSMNTGIGSANQAATAVGANANISFGNGGQ